MSLMMILENIDYLSEDEIYFLEEVEEIVSDIKNRGAYLYEALIHLEESKMKNMFNRNKKNSKQTSSKDKEKVAETVNSEKQQFEETIKKLKRQMPSLSEHAKIFAQIQIERINKIIASIDYKYAVIFNPTLNKAHLLKELDFRVRAANKKIEYLKKIRSKGKWLNSKTTPGNTLHGTINAFNA
jgi:predicted RNA-binding protein YlxR (DUF448 family)